MTVPRPLPPPRSGTARRGRAAGAVLAAAAIAVAAPPVAHACAIELLLYVPIEHLVTLRVALAPLPAACASSPACDGGGAHAR